MVHILLNELGVFLNKRVNPVALMQSIAGSTELQNLTLILRVMWPFLCLMKSEAFKWLHLMTLSDSF